MKASVIVPTYNGASKIPALLKALASQSFTDFELIVVNDGSTDNTNETVTRLISGFHHVQLIQQENKGRAASRNAGAKKASGDILIFFDDDVEPLEQVVASHMHHHQTHPDTILVGQLHMDIRHTKNDFFDFRYAIEKKWDSFFPNSFDQVSLEKYRFTSQNLSLKRELFFSLNGFDERLRDSEDFDFSMKALIKKIPIYYNKDIFAWHRDFTDLAGYTERLKAYKHSKGRLLELHPEYYQLHPGSFEINAKQVHPLKKFISGFFIYNWLWKTCLRSKLFLKSVPKKIRFRLYEIIIYSSTLNDK